MLDSQEECIALLEQLRWGGQPQCPYCNSTKAASLKKEQRYHCNNCFTSYSVTVNTPFHKTRVDLVKWFKVIDWMLIQQQQVKLRQTARRLGMNKDTVSYMVLRIRRASEHNDELLLAIINYLKTLS